MSNVVFDFPVTVAPAPVFGGDEGDLTESLITTARKMLLLRFAVGSYLDAIGGNYAIPRPPQDPGDDELYRRVIQVLAGLPSTILFTTYGLLSAVFGTQAAIIQGGSRPWRVYEVNPNEFIIEIPGSLIATSNANASYLHGFSGYASVVSGPSNTFTTVGDVTAIQSTSIVGNNCYVYVSGAWVTYTVLAASYNATTGLSTVQVSAATIPTGGGKTYILVTGNSFTGDYLASDGVISTFSTPAGPSTTSLLVQGDVSQDVIPNCALTVGINAVLTPRIATSATYSAITNLTTVVVTVAVPGGLTDEAFIRPGDVSVDPAVSVAERVYLTGLGPFEIVQFYMDLMVRAAGVVLRLEII